jgi:hypothetical protein
VNVKFSFTNTHSNYSITKKQDREPSSLVLVGKRRATLAEEAQRGDAIRRIKRE